MLQSAAWRESHLKPLLSTIPEKESTELGLSSFRNTKNWEPEGDVVWVPAHAHYCDRLSHGAGQMVGYSGLESRPVLSQRLIAWS